MDTFTDFVAKKRKKSAEGVRPLTISVRPNASGDYGATPDQVDEAGMVVNGSMALKRKKKKGPMSLPTNQNTDIGMVSPMTPRPDDFTGNMVGDMINTG